MSNQKVRGKNKCQESWLSKEEYKAWLEKGSIEYAARCKLCRKEICIDNMDVQKISVSYAVVSAEIKWSMKTVMSHFFVSSCLDLNALFQDMFSDSEVAKKFQLSKTKVIIII